MTPDSIMAYAMAAGAIVLVAAGIAVVIEMLT